MIIIHINIINNSTTKPNLIIVCSIYIVSLTCRTYNNNTFFPNLS